MILLTVLWSMSASACLTLAMIHFLIWWRQRNQWSHLLFTLTAVGTAALAGFELLYMRVQSISEAQWTLRWAHPALWLIIVSLAGFVKTYFRAGRLWLLYTVCGLRTLLLLVDAVTGESVFIRRITVIRTVRWLGESISVPIGSPNPWMIVGQISTWLLMLFAIDASVAAWQRGERQKAITLGGAIVSFVALSAMQAVAVFWWHLDWPITVSLFYLAIVIAMSFELSRDALAAAQLARDLADSQRQLALADQAHREKVAHLLRVATLGEISSALAHEVNQPLAAILSNAQAAQRLMARDTFDAAEIRDILTDIVADDQRADAVIRRMRTLLKRGELHPQRVCIRELVRSVLELLRSDLTGRGVSVDVDLAETLPPVWGDPIQLQQVLINLILNAGDAMANNAPGSRRLHISSSRSENNLAEICICDSGPGIPLADLEAVFEPYHTTKPQGLGLGLSLSRSIAVEHGGRLWATNQPTGGALLCFTIPFAQGHQT